MLVSGLSDNSTPTKSNPLKGPPAFPADMASTKFSIFSPAAKSAPPAQNLSEGKPKPRSQPLPPPPEPAFVLHKQRSWSPDIDRDEEWSRFKRKQQRHLRHGGSVSVTDDDLKELKACVDLGFGFDTPNLDPKLARTFPALELYSAVNRLSRSSSWASSDESESSGSSPSLSNLLDPSDGPEKVKARLRQWAQVVACSVREASPTKLVN